MAMRILYRFKLAQHVPLSGGISYADLSKACGLDEGRLTRLVRFLILDHIFVEDAQARVYHSAASKLLATEQSDTDFLGHNTEDVFPGCFEQVRALENAPHSTDVKDCGISLAHSDGKSSFFEVLSTDEARMKRFGGAMAFANSPGTHTAVDTLLVAFDWPASGPIKVVDVGGSMGHTAAHILSVAPQIKQIVVQDLPDVIAQAKSEAPASKFPNQIQLEGASFFDPQPVTDADVYLFRNVFVDWPEDKAVEILKNVVPSMKPGSILLINEPLVTDPGTTNPYTEKIARMLDLQMMVALNAFVKSTLDWQRIVEKGGAGMLSLDFAKANVIAFRRV